MEKLTVKVLKEVANKKDWKIKESDAQIGVNYSPGQWAWYMKGVNVLHFEYIHSQNTGEKRGGFLTNQLPMLKRIERAYGKPLL